MKYLLSLFSIIILSVSVFPQYDTIRTFHPNGNPESIIPLYKNIRDGVSKYFFSNGNIKEERNFVNGRVEGEIKLYYESGILKELINIQDGKREGATIYFDSKGEFISEVFFEKGELIKDENYFSDSNEKIELEEMREEKLLPPVLLEKIILPTIEETDSVVYHNPEIKAIPVKGISEIYERLSYPVMAREKNIQGTVLVEALIDEFGDVTQTRIIKGLGFGCDDAAATTIYFTKFIPAKHRGKVVSSFLVIPVEFKFSK